MQMTRVWADILGYSVSINILFKLKKTPVEESEPEKSYPRVQWLVRISDWKMWKFVSLNIFPCSKTMKTALVVAEWIGSYSM